ncbi:MAG: nucleotidyltransferase family protein [Candidatus Woesearchaeota archaeon]|jgi:NDP-sugar pyrophosphorylase family protein
MKERVTLTIEQNILESVDNRVDGFKIKNRSHAVELLLMKAMDQSRPKIAFILAGGKGTRLRPITNEIPKPMMPLHDKPILQHALDLFKKYGITEIVMSIGYKGEKIKEYFGNGTRFGVNITYIEEIEPLGTAGPLNLARQYLTDTFVMCNADELKNIDLNEMYLFHKDNGAMATIALTTVPDPTQYGVAKLMGSKILEFIEKPAAGTAPSNLINAGLYILEPSVLDSIPKGTSSIERDVFPTIATNGKLFGFPFSGQWFDTGTLERYEDAMQKWTDIV